MGRYSDWFGSEYSCFVFCYVLVLYVYGQCYNLGLVVVFIFSLQYFVDKFFVYFISRILDWYSQFFVLKIGK